MQRSLGGLLARQYNCHEQLEPIPGNVHMSKTDSHGSDLRRGGILASKIIWKGRCCPAGTCPSVTSLLAKPDPVMQPLILAILQKNGAMDPSISSNTCLPEGLQSVLQQRLLPQLPLQALQSLAQACQDTKRLVQSAQASMWHSALGQGGLPVPCELGSRPQAGHTYSTIAQVARQQAAFQAGHSWSRAVQSYRYYGSAHSRSFMALEPDFTRMISLWDSHVILTPSDPRQDEPYAMCSAGHMPGKSSLFGLGEYASAPDGMHFVLKDDLEIGTTSTQGLSLFKLDPGPTLVGTLNLGSKHLGIDWAPNSQVLIVEAKEKGYLCHVPAADGNALQGLPLPAHSGDSSYYWSPCSSYIAAGWCHSPTWVVICARQRIILSKVQAVGHDIGWCDPMAWVHFDNELSLALCTDYEDCGGEMYLSTLQLQRAHRSESWGNFHLGVFKMSVGYEIAGRYRVAGLAPADWGLVLFDLTKAGYGPITSAACYDIAPYTGVNKPDLAWCPGNSIWLAVASVEAEHFSWAADDVMYTAKLTIVNGRSGVSAYQTILAESPEEIYFHTVTWSSSGTALMIVLAIAMAAAEDDGIPRQDPACKQRWIRKYLRWG